MKDEKDKNFDHRDKDNYWNPNKKSSNESKKSSIDLADGEKKADDKEKQESPDKNSFNYASSGTKSRGQKVAVTAQKIFGGKKKYGWGVGGIIGLLIGLLFFLAPLFGPLQMLENLEDFHLGPRRNTISIRSIKVIKKIRANATTNPNADPVTKRLNDVDINDLSSELNAKGLALEVDTNGSPTGVIDTDGTFRSLDNVDEVVNLVDEAVPVARASNRGYMRNLFTASTGYSWSSILGRADPDASIWSWIRTRARLADADIDTSIKNNTDADGTPVDLGDGVNDVNSGSAIVDDAAEAAQTKALEGGTSAEVTKAGVDSFKSKINPKSIGLATFILACTSKAVYDNQLQMRWNNFKGAVATFFDLAIISDEVKHGDVNTVKHIGEFMENYSNDTGSFASSAAWQEISGQPITGPGLLPENDVNSSLTSDGFLGSILGLVAAGGSVVDQIPLVSQFCGIFNSLIGTAIGGIVANFIDWGSAAFEVVGACVLGSATFGATCAAKVGATVAFEIGLPRLFSVVLSAFVDKIIDDPAQAFNYLSHAGALVNSESSRTGRPVDNETYAKNDLQPYLQESRAEHSSLYAKWLSPDNPTSMISQVGQWKTSIVHSEKNFGTITATILKAPFSFANLIFNNLTGLNKRVSAAPGETSPHDSIQKYSYRTDSLDSDPVLLANEVTAMLEDDVVLRDTAKYCMGYDSATDRLDPSLQLPLYSNPGTDESGFFAQLGSIIGGSQDAEAKNKIVQDYCIPNASGGLNSGVTLDEYEKLGRFVDDLMIIETMNSYLSPGYVYSSGISTGAGGSGGSGGGGTNICEVDGGGNVIVNPGDEPCAL